MHQMIINVTDEQLAYVKTRLEEDGEFTVTNPLKVLQEFLKNEIHHIDVYMEDAVLNGGGNSLGDALQPEVFDRLQKEGVLVPTRPLEDVLEVTEPEA